MQRICLVVVLFFTTFGFTQEAESVQKEIDQHLWKPFKVAFETVDVIALNALYGEEVLRVTPNGIDTENQFRAANLKRFNDYKVSGTKVALDFWFDSRHTNATTSYEVGFYRMKLSNDEGKNTIYGQFHIVLRKTDGIWKITQDWDTTEINGDKIGPEDFEKQRPVKF
jgi:ketosteroid isomerase-like protein